VSDRLRDLSAAHGQSPWLDNLQRSFFSAGALDTLIRRGVRGLTSNPTIFQKAIQGSTDYDAQFAAEIARGLTPVEAYWELVIADIHSALDCFSDLYAATGGADGFVSVEVDPTLAHDGPGTLAAARSLHDRIGRPNVMIKIPATREGLGAIRQMIAEGRNVNVTLIFSLERHAAVMGAYIGGLEDRASAGLPLAGISSVASFFISRVDNEVDGRLEAVATPEALALRGTAAVNQAKLAYALFRDTFSGPRWEALAAAGAQVQRPLWASTSTKNPTYPDTLYVDSLIGPDTVNTLPEATLEAFADHGSPARTVDSAVDSARRQWDSLAEQGVDTADVAEKLEREGVAAFIASFDDLIAALEAKAAALGGR
jgi:transaldolase